MNYQTYVKFSKSIAAGILVLAVTACSESSDNAEPSVDREVIKAQEAAELAETKKFAKAAGGEGTWGDIVYGDPNAPVVVIEYASFTCPACANFAINIFPKIKENYIDAGKIKFVYRNLVRDQYDMAASLVARCRTPDVAKHLTKIFFERQRDWTGAEDKVAGLAMLARRAVGMSRIQVDRCIANTDMQQHLVKMTQGAAVRYNASATPTIIVDGSKVGVASLENIKAVIDAKL